MKSGLAINKIKSVVNSQKRDICQAGVVLANQFSETETEYGNIWTAAQDIFDDKMMEGDYYILKKKFLNEYSKKLFLYLKSKRYIGKSKDEPL